ncbi:MAG: hypothetical protein AMJ70_07820, partial [Dehalococcoidia bacterium SG8_51_3]
GEAVTISVMVTNGGDLTGTYEVILKMNGSGVGVEEVEVIGGESEKVSFRVTPNAVGTYAVEVASLGGSFVVKEGITSLVPPAPSLPAPTLASPTLPSEPEAPPPPEKSTNWPLIGGIIAGVVVLALLTFFLGRRAIYY